MANSSMFVLPSITVPAALSLATTVASYGDDEVVEHPRAAGRAHALGAEDVLVRERHARERAAAPGGERRVCLRRRGQRVRRASRK